ncbi:endonuclease Q family protein [Methanospirillum sp.]|uniref:endonuclease Q family protein n=1 Tax=Methanospirillum sp. TaxID=45200 RepID=UPI002985119A|nr:endonuclease Q family protein [Methanospirillum sp.]
MQIAADLHLHSCFSMATSPRMVPEEIIKGCRVKGITVIGTGDIFHPEWRQMWLNTSVDDDIIVVPTTEVEGTGRVHHLLLFPDFDAAEELAKRFGPVSKDINSNGRPRVNLSGEEILKHTHEVGGIGGPAHAFTPYTSVYATHLSLSSCYGDEPVDLLELGLSADSRYGAGIAELTSIPFLTNSDAHSPEPSKLGREFTVLELTRADPVGVLNAVQMGKIVMNVGFFPEEGKYNRTACSHCFHQFSLEEAEAYSWKCPNDGKRIKKGVVERAQSLSSGPITERPPYLHIIPLSEIIQRSIGMKSPLTRRCKDLYRQCIDHFGNEITILMDIPLEEIASIDNRLSSAIQSFREGKIIIYPGGGGKYGTFEIPGF